MTFPIADLIAFRAQSDASARQEAADTTARALIEYGCLLVKTDVAEEDNARFLDLLEDYFAQDDDVLLKDTRPEFGYQVGATLENTEKPRCAADADSRCKALISRLDPSERPLDMLVEHSDPKARFFWRMGEAPPSTKFARLNAENVVPTAFSDRWAGALDRWGQQMKESVEGVAEMLAVGLGLPQDAFTSHGKYGTHLLAPTATNLERYGKLGSVWAGFHSDLGFLTIHGRSRYPGLSVWGRNAGKRLEVPPGHLLVQAGMQLEHCTGGLVLAGFHEVACNKASLAAIERARIERPGRPLIRISSTFFWHLDTDYTMAPVPGLRVPPNVDQPALPPASQYPAIAVGDQMERELTHIKLMAS